jgi:hypothetical protein
MRQESIKQLLGLTTEEAVAWCEKNGWVWRITRDDGCSYILTRDYRKDRINLEVENDCITKVSIG